MQVLEQCEANEECMEVSAAKSPAHITCKCFWVLSKVIACQENEQSMHCRFFVSIVKQSANSGKFLLF